MSSSTDHAKGGGGLVEAIFSLVEALFWGAGWGGMSVTGDPTAG